MAVSNDEFAYLDHIGGEDAIKRLSEDFYRRVGASSELKALFPGKSLRCAAQEFTSFVIQFLEGDDDQTQHRWWLSLRESHSRFKVSEAQRREWIRLMEETMSSQPEFRALYQLFDASSKYITGLGVEEPINHLELQKHWKKQCYLEGFIDAISTKDDESAIALSRSFLDRSSILIGILERMMFTSRKPLIGFAIECIEKVPSLQTDRFNGRTLLHCAARAPCIEVVQKLLLLGVTPNLLDHGNQTPLYAACSSRKDALGVPVVQALIKAGATLDIACGVNRSTALHQAARFGNVHIAECLLDAGADLRVKDKNGFTAEDRARNCRKSSVLELLKSRTTVEGSAK